MIFPQIIFDCPEVTPHKSLSPRAATKSANESSKMTTVSPAVSPMVEKLNAHEVSLLRHSSIGSVGSAMSYFSKNQRTAQNMSNKCNWCYRIGSTPSIQKFDILFDSDFRHPRSTFSTPENSDCCVKSLEVSSPELNPIEVGHEVPVKCMWLLGHPTHCLGLVAEDLDKLMNVFPNETERESIRNFSGGQDELRDVERKVSFTTDE